MAEAEDSVEHQEEAAALVAVSEVDVEVVQETTSNKAHLTTLTLSPSFHMFVRT